MKRLHPLGVILAAGGVAGLPAVIIIGLAVAQGELGRIANIAVTVLLAGAGWGVAEWWRFRYGVIDDSLVVERGIFTLERKVVHRDRIRGIDLSAPVIHRLLGLRRVTVDAAADGGKGSELSLSAVSIADGEALQRELLGDATGESAAPAIATADLRTLAIAGATGPRWLAVPFGIVGAMAGALAAAGEDVWRPLVDGVGDRLGGLGVGALAALVGLALLAVVATAAAASVLSDGGFRLTTPPGRLVSERGLLRRRQVSIDRGRVAALGIREALTWRLLGLASVRARITGVGADSGAGAGRTQMHPATARPTAEALVRRIFPAAPRAAQAHPRRALPRRVVRALAPVLLLALGLLVAGRLRDAVLAVVLLAPAAWVAVDRWRSLASGFNGRLLRLREGSLTRRTTIVDPAVIVEYRVRSSPFQRRAGLCTLEVRMGRGAGSARALDAGEAEAAALARRLDPALLHKFLTGQSSNSRPETGDSDDRAP